MQKVRPKKELGQHFLTDMGVARRIASTLDGYRGVPVLEVGPGMGVLTRFLLEAGHDLTVVELDSESVEYLRANEPALQDRIVEGDFLRLDLERLMGGRDFCVIGNYPYNISSQIFFRILDCKDRVPCCSGMRSARWPSVLPPVRQQGPGVSSACCCRHGTRSNICLP